MLKKIHIQNYAIIDELTVAFAEGLNIITGETGAGKSILMGALNLILGQRADSSVLQHTDRKCIVEGVFQIKQDKAMAAFFEANDLDMEPLLFIRREINANGKSRSFINDTPVNLSQLKQLSILLVDLHQQFDTLEINSENFQREVLDAFAGNASLLIQLKEEFEAYDHTRKTLAELVARQQAANKELDYNRYLYEELEVLALQENELEQLDAELKLLSNAEMIKQQLQSIYYELKDSDQPLVQQLKALSNRVKSLEGFHAGISTLSERLLSTVIELQDISNELEEIDDGIQLDAARIVVINEKISAGYKLLKKHGVQETNQLLEIQQALQEKLETVLQTGTRIAELELAQKNEYEACIKTAAQLSANRQAQIKGFVTRVNTLLSQVGMPNAVLKVTLQPAALQVTGTDTIEFLFDANKSNRFEPLGKVASGGELSRLMLSIKSLVAQKLALPTLIFDEIDTGISGEAARQVGIIMKSLSSAHQLIAITHQPQIAAKASAHYFVYKEAKADKIVTNVRILNNEERITAIAKMLSGEKPTAAALENAKEMVEN